MKVEKIAGYNNICSFPPLSPMSMLQEFKEFAMKGNVVDLAVGVIIGGAFGKIVTSLVNDIIMPIFGIVLQGVDFSGLSFSVGEATIMYGSFLQSVFDFLIVASCIFLMIKQMNRMKKPAPAPAAAVTPEDILLLREIRDALKK